MRTNTKNFIKKTKKNLKGGSSGLLRVLTSRSLKNVRRLPQTTRILPQTTYRKSNKRLPSRGRTFKSVSSRKRKFPNTYNRLSAYNPPELLFYKPKETETKKNIYFKI